MANLTVNTFAVNPETEKALRKHIIIKLKLTPEEPQSRERMLSLNENKLIHKIHVHATCRTVHIMPVPVSVPQPHEQTGKAAFLIQHPNVERLKGEKGCEGR